ncbi:hypothetical protein DSO57_1028961 [Entomophthora muscae]|uniref:Uncharacterized protein n=1 Tax=Entomophthora muscae TaxID=34485 RepID=A0ACC2S3J8_9FUNG|nr:hypothetical protein DSO57_1028961 [Entomophthora muscae]
MLNRATCRYDSKPTIKLRAVLKGDKDRGALRGVCISLALFQILLAGALVILVADDPSGTPAWLCLPYALASVMFAAKGIYDATQYVYPAGAMWVYDYWHCGIDPPNLIQRTQSASKDHMLTTLHSLHPKTYSLLGCFSNCSLLPCLKNQAHSITKHKSFDGTISTINVQCSLEMTSPPFQVSPTISFTYDIPQDDPISTKLPYPHPVFHSETPSNEDLSLYTPAHNSVTCYDTYDYGTTDVKRKQ